MTVSCWVESFDRVSARALWDILRVKRVAGMSVDLVGTKRLGIFIMAGFGEGDGVIVWEV